MTRGSKFKRTIQRLLKTPPQPHSEQQKAREEKDLKYLARGINPETSKVDRVMVGKRKKKGN